MCTIFLALRQHSDYPVILLANRDEFLDREALAMHPWKEYGILAGRDVKAGGTWLAFEADGSFSLVTNYRSPAHMGSGEKSRGELPILALQESEFFGRLKKDHVLYNGFNLIRWKDGYLDWAGFGDEYREGRFEEGIFGLSNAYMNTPWPKVEKGKHWLEEQIDSNTFSIDAALSFLGDDSLAPKEDLPQTGVPKDWELHLSALNIRYQNYGTRVSTVYTLDKEGRGEVVELNRISDELRHFELKSGEFRSI